MPRFIHLLSIAIFLLFLSTGCTRVVSHRVAEYRPGGDSTIQPIPESAIYSIRFVDEDGNKVGGVIHSHRFLRKGEPVGFTTDEAGAVRAIALTSDFPIEIPPGHAAVWSSHYRKQTQFGKEMEKAAHSAGKAAMYTGAVVGVGALLILAPAADCHH
jgi:hypothetical protein